MSFMKVCPYKRHYNSDLSIWLSVDPMANKYPSLSPYTYCADNPVKLVDPDGRDLWKPDGKGGWIAQPGDNAWTLHRDAGISYEKAIDLMKSQGFVFTDNDRMVKVQVGDRVQITTSSSQSNASLYTTQSIPYRPLATGRIEYSSFNVEDIILPTKACSSSRENGGIREAASSICRRCLIKLGRHTTALSCWVCERFSSFSSMGIICGLTSSVSS